MEARSQSASRTQGDEMNFIFNLNAFSWKTMQLTATRHVTATSITKTLTLRLTLVAGSRS